MVIESAPSWAKNPCGSRETAGVL